MRRFVTADDEVGQRLDVALSRWLGESRSAAAARIDRGEVRLRGEPAKRSMRLDSGDEVEVDPPPPEPSGADGTPPPPIRYEDADLLVVAKPAGLVVHPGVGHPAGTMVQALEEAGYPLAPAGGEGRPGIVHRLDRDTSGLLVVAKTDRAHEALVDALRARRVERRYVTLVEGRLPAVSGTVDAPIGRDRRERTRFTVTEEGRAARTRWEVLEVGTLSGDEVSLLACALETGRTHQIRVHLAFAGHAVVGDATYGARAAVAAAAGLDRPFLHATRLAFTHPVTGDRVELEEPLPADLMEALERAGIPCDPRPTGERS